VGHVHNSGLSITYLLFVDDTLIFCDADMEQLRNLRCLFFCFEATSGLKINLLKSEIVPIGEMQDIGLLANIFGCRVVGLHMKYLGLPLGAHQSLVLFFFFHRGLLSLLLFFVIFCLWLLNGL
jgi:hypothetical protein